MPHLSAYYRERPPSVPPSTISHITCRIDSVTRLMNDAIRSGNWGYGLALEHQLAGLKQQHEDWKRSPHGMSPWV